MNAGGALILGWALVVWQWRDPFTALYTLRKQHELAQSLEREPATRASSRRTATSSTQASSR